MIHSMTGFAKASVQNEWGILTWEIRAVNHRFLDVYFRLPEPFRQLENNLREIIRDKITRGKIECILQFKPGEKSNAHLAVNINAVKELANAIGEIQNIIPNAEKINPIKILSWPGVLQTSDEELQPLYDEISKLFIKALTELLQTREREGKALVAFFEPKLQEILAQTKKIKTRIPEIINLQKAKILEHLAEIKTELDTNRLEQEMVFFAQKIDVCEEMERLETHVKEMQRILKSGGNIGKRLDFLLQEFNREANTTASKSVDPETSKIAIELKVIIEQMREQVQNLE